MTARDDAIAALYRRLDEAETPLESSRVRSTLELFDASPNVIRYRIRHARSDGSELLLTVDVCREHEAGLSPFHVGRVWPPTHPVVGYPTSGPCTYCERAPFPDVYERPARDVRGPRALRICAGCGVEPTATGDTYCAGCRSALERGSDVAEWPAP